jgi:hypothetical protein
MEPYLIIRFSNESSVIEAEAGWSSDGRVFSDPSETAHAILPGASETLMDMTMRQLVTSLCATLPEQADDEEQFIRDNAEQFLGYIADAVHLEREIIYTLDADAGQLPPTILR